MVGIGHLVSLYRCMKNHHSQLRGTWKLDRGLGYFLKGFQMLEIRQSLLNYLPVSVNWLPGLGIELPLNGLTLILMAQQENVS